MIRTLDDLPDGVIGFEADGEIHAEDYATTRQDLQMGVEHLTHWKQIALVTDVEWMMHLSRLFGWMTPGEFKHFPLDERDAAVAWAAAD